MRKSSLSRVTSSMVRRSVPPGTRLKTSCMTHGLGPDKGGCAGLERISACTAKDRTRESCDENQAKTSQARLESALRKRSCGGRLGSPAAAHCRQKSYILRTKVAIKTTGV